MPPWTWIFLAAVKSTHLSRSLWLDLQPLGLHPTPSLRQRPMPRIARQSELAPPAAACLRTAVCLPGSCRLVGQPGSAPSRSRQALTRLGARHRSAESLVHQRRQRDRPAAVELADNPVVADARSREEHLIEAVGVIHL